MSTRGDRPMQVDEKAASGRAEKRAILPEPAVEQIERRHAEKVASLQAEAGAEAGRLAEVHAGKMADYKNSSKPRWETLESEWKNKIEPLYAAIPLGQCRGGPAFSAGGRRHSGKTWTPPQEFQNAARFGRLEVELANARRKDAPGPAPGASRSGRFNVPLALAFPLQGSILFETGKAGGSEAVAAINNIIFRLLSTTPPGKLTFTIFDPVGLGQSFAALMHLADYEESYINSRIWTQTAPV